MNVPFHEQSTRTPDDFPLNLEAASSETEPTTLNILIPKPGLTPVARPPLGFDVVPGYEVLSELGRGGMGVVYKAKQLGLNRIVALKMILAGDHAGAQERERFQQEAQAIARLQHPNIVQVYEVKEHNGRPYFSLEFCAGG